MRQTPDPTAQFNDPAAWITTGTPTGSSDPKTAEMLESIRRHNTSDEITTLSPALAGFLLLPDGELTSDLSLAVFESDWMAREFDQLLAGGGRVILYWGPRMPPQWVWAMAEADALRHHRMMTGEDS